VAPLSCTLTSSFCDNVITTTTFSVLCAGGHFSRPGPEYHCRFHCYHSDAPLPQRCRLQNARTTAGECRNNSSDLPTVKPWILHIYCRRGQEHRKPRRLGWQCCQNRRSTRRGMTVLKAAIRLRYLCPCCNAVGSLYCKAISMGLGPGSSEAAS
jgi:hypothetical protein